MKIIGLTGLIGSGKSTAGTILKKDGYIELQFGDALKDVVSVLFNWDRKMLSGDTPESRKWRETVNPIWEKRLGIKDFSPRMALQLIGTDVFRKHFHPDIWLFNITDKITKHDKVVLTDCRFANESKLIHDLGGIVVRIKRGKDPEWYQTALSGSRMSKLYPNVHVSEYASIGHEDCMIDNNGTIEDLKNQITKILSK